MVFKVDATSSKAGRLDARKKNERSVIARAAAAQRWLALLLVSAPVAACFGQQDERPSAVAECETRIIVGLEGAPNEELMSDLAESARARLMVVETVTTNLHVLDLRAAGADAECSAAIERLRADPRVRSVDVDVRRQAHPR
jgi:hypothetical protein